MHSVAIFLLNLKPSNVHTGHALAASICITGTSETDAMASSTSTTAAGKAPGPPPVGGAGAANPVMLPTYWRLRHLAMASVPIAAAAAFQPPPLDADAGDRARKAFPEYVEPEAFETVGLGDAKQDPAPMPTPQLTGSLSGSGGEESGSGVYVQQPTPVIASPPDDPGYTRQLLRVKESWARALRNSVTATLAVFSPSALLQYLREPPNIMRDIAAVEALFESGAHNPRSHLTPTEWYSVCSGPMSDDALNDSLVHPPDPVGETRYQLTVVGDSGALLFKGRGGHSTLWPVIKDVPGFQNCRVLTKMGAGIAGFTEWLEAVLFEYGLGPASWRASAFPTPSGAPPVGAAEGAADLGKVREMGGTDLIRLAPSQRLLLILYNGNDLLGDAKDVTMRADCEEILRRFVGTTNYFQKVVFGYSTCAEDWGLNDAWRQRMKFVVSFMAANGITCINLDHHYGNLRAAGASRGQWHFNASWEAQQVWTSFIKQTARYMAKGMVPWAWKLQAAQTGLLRQRRREQAGRILPALAGTAYAREQEQQAQSQRTGGSTSGPPPAGGAGVPSYPTTTTTPLRPAPSQSPDLRPSAPPTRTTKPPPPPPATPQPKTQPNLTRSFESMTAQAAAAAKNAAVPNLTPGTPQSFGPTLQEARNIPQQKRPGRRPTENVAWAYDPWEPPDEQQTTGTFFSANDVFAKAGAAPAPRPSPTPSTSASASAAQASAAPPSAYTKAEMEFAKDVYKTHQ